MDFCWIFESNCKIDFQAWGAIATVVVGLLAWSATRAAARAAADAATVAKQQREDSDTLRQAQARILEQMLFEEILDLPMKTAAAYQAIDAAIDWNQGCTIRNGQALEAALASSQETWLPVTVMNQDRIHYLRPDFGEVLAQLLATNRALNAMASKMASRIRPPERNFIGANRLPLYAGSNTDFLSLRRALDRISQMSVLFAGSFASAIKLRDASTLGSETP